MKTLFTVVSLAALMVLPAMAQETTAPNTGNAPPAAGQPTAAPSAKGEKITSGEISASQLLNESVLNEANESVGDVNDVLITSDGKIASVIVGVGGFLGMGEKDVALAFDQLSFARDNDNDIVVTTNVTKESLQAAPAYQKLSKH